MSCRARQLGVIALARGFAPGSAAAVALGAGTAMVYPTLLAVDRRRRASAWRGTAVGVYRLWRDSAMRWGRSLAGLLADRFGMAAAIGVVAAITVASGLEVAVRMPETLRRTVPR